MSNYQVTTINGYDFFEIASAFQKAIRRGEEETAMQMAVELFNSNFGGYVWKRIKIITSEDIGLAEINMPSIIESLFNNYLEQTKKKDEKHQPERLFLTHAVLLLCRAKKSRLVDWTLLYYWNSKEPLKIPEYTYDMHTKKGRQAGKDKKHFYTEATKLENHSLQDGEEEMKTKSYGSNGNLFE